MSKVSRSFETEKDNLKKDYEILLANVREEYKRCTHEMRIILEQKNEEISDLSERLKGVENNFRRERAQIEDTLHKDSY